MPIDKSDEDQREKLKSNKTVLKKVSDYIESEQFDKSQSLESFYASILQYTIAKWPSLHLHPLKLSRYIL